jgi:5-methylcytosine-specific restriction endonuclease McrA
MDSTNITQCEKCEKSFKKEIKKNRDGSPRIKRFCSRACYDESRAEIILSREKDCIGCGKPFLFISSDKKYCTDACWRISQTPEPRNCLNCNTMFSPVKFARGIIYRPTIQRTCSTACLKEWPSNNEERKEKISFAFSAEKHPNWQGGKSLRSNVSARGPGWAKQRKAALKKDNYACVDCGITDEESKVKYGSSLDVDHVIPFHNFSDYKKANRVNNLECRCKSCHKKEEAKRVGIQMVIPMSIGRRETPYKPENKMTNAKLSKFDVISIRIMHKNGKNTDYIHGEYPRVTRGSILNIISGKTWSSI